jgi:hypothetical protein
MPKLRALILAGTVAGTLLLGGTAHAQEYTCRETSGPLGLFRTYDCWPGTSSTPGLFRERYVEDTSRAWWDRPLLVPQSTWPGSSSYDRPSLELCRGLFC